MSSLKNNHAGRKRSTECIKKCPQIHVLRLCGLSCDDMLFCPVTQKIHGPSEKKEGENVAVLEKKNNLSALF